MNLSGAGGRINAYLENMEQFDYETGGDSPADEDAVTGRLEFGSAVWTTGHTGMNRYPWNIPDYPLFPGKPKPGEPGWDMDPGFSPGWLGPWSRGRWGRDKFPGGYGNPNYGLGDQAGSFVGIGRMDAACNVPNDMQPSTPPGGLFGPGANPPLWGNPGYSPPPDTTRPWLTKPELMTAMPPGMPPDYDPDFDPTLPNPGPPGFWTDPGDSINNMPGGLPPRPGIPEGRWMTGSEMADLFFARKDAEAYAQTGHHLMRVKIVISCMGKPPRQRVPGGGEVLTTSGSVLQWEDQEGKKQDVSTDNTHAVEYSGEPDLPKWTKVVRAIGWVGIAVGTIGLATIGIGVAVGAAWAMNIALQSPIATGIAYGVAGVLYGIEVAKDILAIVTTAALAAWVKLGPDAVFLATVAFIWYQTRPYPIQYYIKQAFSKSYNAFVDMWTQIINDIKENPPHFIKDES